MSLKKKKASGGGANWMDTYGDMVTLLLCFFVMLFSMSSVDQTKWIALVQALNPQEYSPTGTAEDVPPEGSHITDQMTQEDVDEALEELYESMASYIQQAALEGQVSIGKGSGYVFITFDDTVFFEGNSYYLLDSGAVMLDEIANSVAEAGDAISEIRVLGHTAQVQASNPNVDRFDRFLASNRATEVTLYLQEKDIIDPAKLVSVGYGQWRPVAQNDTTDGRAKNRRVELIVTGLDIDGETGDGLTQYYTMRESVGTSVTPDTGTATTASTYEPES